MQKPPVYGVVTKRRLSLTQSGKNTFLGSGCARGFLGAYDAAWMVRNWSSNNMTPLEVIAERETIYKLLPQVTPENLHKNHHQYSINPDSRYPNLNKKLFTADQVTQVRTMFTVQSMFVRFFFWVVKGKTGSLTH